MVPQSLSGGFRVVAPHARVCRSIQYIMHECCHVSKRVYPLHTSASAHNPVVFPGHRIHNHFDAPTPKRSCGRGAASGPNTRQTARCIRRTAQRGATAASAAPTQHWQFEWPTAPPTNTAAAQRAGRQHTRRTAHRTAHSTVQGIDSAARGDNRGNRPNRERNAGDRCPPLSARCRFTCMRRLPGLADQWNA
jgi:hypothetical protein